VFGSFHSVLTTSLFVIYLKFSEGINAALDKYIPEDLGINIISEPGRYFVQESCTLIVNVIGKKTETRETANAKNAQEERGMGSIRTGCVFKKKSFQPMPVWPHYTI
jgi:hypothetical protein